MFPELVVLKLLTVTIICSDIRASSATIKSRPHKRMHYQSREVHRKSSILRHNRIENDYLETNFIGPPSRPTSSSHSSPFSWDDLQFRPYFDNKNEDNVTAQLGKTAQLHCRIRQLANRTVSWVRQRDLHILTAGQYTYTSDQRFSCIHLENSDDWTLEIKYVQKDDAGVYECQVNTEPKMSLSIRLSIVANKALIPEGPELFVESGAVIKLTCIIYETSSSSLYIFWYREGTVINYDSKRDGIKVTTERGPSTVSHLEILDAKVSDSGEYSCKPSFAEFANITVHVSDEFKQKSELKEIQYHQLEPEPVEPSGSRYSRTRIYSDNFYTLLIGLLICIDIFYHNY
ncbi:zwei Ig domain protein zig-8-like [Brevipalpus obovatus]|uniref:zwei Ig domain protein zig-8-like n=1 Tax=Brevipalpus obovatus TaxID=246614 RepID=UPI003D9F80DD